MSILFPSPNPPILSLFSSSDTFPPPLWSQHTDPQLTSESLIVPLHSDVSSAPMHVLPDDVTLVHCSNTTPSSSSSPPPTPLSTASDPSVAPARSRPRNKGLLTHPTIHIQSPSIHTTYLRCPPSSAPHKELGVEHDWLHLQLRRLGGRRELAIEVGLRDARGVEGRLRIASFTEKAHLKRPSSSTSIPLLQLPLRFPSTSSSTLTPWLTVSLSLPALLSLFTSITPPTNPFLPVPNVHASRGATWTFVKVYANCRLRRVWFSQGREGGETGLDSGREELGLVLGGVKMLGVRARETRDRELELEKRKESGSAGVE